MGQSVRTKILSALYDRRGQPLSDTTSSEDLAHLIDMPWNEIRHEVEYLEEKGYIGSTDLHVGKRIYRKLHLTAKGVDAVEGKVIDESIHANERPRPTIGIITALPKEYVAIEVLLENKRSYLIPGLGAGRRYLLGELPAANTGKHSIVLSLADMGNNIAAARATLLLEHFSSVAAIIMLGIAGGLPHPDKPDEHVRLGDVVVSGNIGVIQYDFDKETIIGTAHRQMPRPPSATLLEGVRLLEAAELRGNRPWLPFIDQASRFLGVTRPSTESDFLASPLDPSERLTHPKDPKRAEGQPRVFVGPIASANKLLKNPIKRDQLRDKFGVKAVEMEGSGIADATWNHERGYLVVRGICDYCDSNKGDDWQAYAAVVAAAYVRALIESMPA